ncbi:NERD domain-containing protein [Gryllotalpicola protaetiae]|uniref:NERD domain-containing protein n=1 Tax=Gryllotalpicola protaetiae TaxID=2419771 RepID=A0A387BRC0_9MICO|nr:NERD domain-containing protein [Gryllotalpicola protaetiae]
MVTDLTQSAAPTASLASRPPAASVITQCLAEQSKLTGRKRIADILGLSPLTDDALPWFTGALGELAVGRELARLDAAKGWVVLHSVPVGNRDSDIDHVVIGPAGVFTINTKHHSGQRISTGRSLIFVSGQAKPYIRNSVFEAERASKRLTEAVGFPVTAHPVLAFVDPKELAGKRDLDGVHLVDAAGLRSAL